MDDLRELTAFDLAGIGHNGGGDLDLLREACEDLAAPLRTRLAMLREGTSRLEPAIATRDEAENTADALRMLAALRQVIDEQRKTAKAPHLDAAKQVESFFAALADEVKVLEMDLSPRLVAWLDAQPRRESGKVRVRTVLGAVASLSETTRIAVDDILAVDLDALRPFLDHETLEKAARAYFAERKAVPAGFNVEPVRRLIIR